MKGDITQQIHNLKAMIDEVLKDRGIPRNIRETINIAKNKIDEKNPNPQDLSAVIYSLDDISNDINMPTHTRTSIWEIISELERLKEMLK